MNAAEDRLSELMDAATRALAPPIDSILAEGERLGRRRRRRHRAAVATGTAAVVLLAGAGVAAGLRMTRMDHDDIPAAAAVGHRASSAPSTSGTTAPSGTATPVPARTVAAVPSTTQPLVPITANAAVVILRMRLGAGWTFSSYKPSSDGLSLLDVDVNDGKGLSRIFVAVSSVKKSGAYGIDCKSQTPLLLGDGPRPSGAPAASCAVQRDAAGNLIMEEVLRADAYGEYQYRVVADRVDGVSVEIALANGDWGSAATEVTRPLPPLTVASLTQLALDPLWQLQVPAKLAKLAG